MRKNFVYYGTYDLQMRKPGYETLTATPKVWAPWWQVPPFDFAAELVPLPLMDKHKLEYSLKPIEEESTDPVVLIERGNAMRSQLQGSRVKKRPTAAATQPE